ncbi:MAG TPA: glutaredoxin family protein [Candidatus Binatia bacterium]|nr:glutaredoxin family protein [Candidatus Binatia bacterium]
MKAKLLLYSRADCCLCDEMKETIRQVAAKIPLEMEEIDVDGSAELRERFGSEVPVLFIDGRKAFKYRVTAKELGRRVGSRSFWRRWGAIREGA